MTLAAPGVPKGTPAVTTNKSAGSETRPFLSAARHAFRSTRSKSLFLVSSLMLSSYSNSSSSLTFSKITPVFGRSKHFDRDENS